MLPNWRNRTLFHGDNLDFLRGMNSGTVHLIATDPPFNKGRDFHATPDSLAAGARFQDRWSWSNDVEGAWIDQIQDDWPAVWEVIDAARAAWGDDMAAFLCFMAVRVIEMRRVLRDDGSLYLHCDPTASHYLKALLDAVFGRRNFKNDVAWRYGGSGRGAKAIAKHFPKNHDNILYYAKDRRTHAHQGVWTSIEHPFDDLPSHIRRDSRGYFKTAPRGDYTDASVARLRAEGRIYETRTGTIRIRYNLETSRRGVLEPRLAGSVWDFPDMMHSPPMERQGYPTQKPRLLYERMIEASSPEHGVVLDPFAGCATTLVAAERLGRQWVGIDIWPDAHALVERRLNDERQLLTEIPPAVHLESTPPERTDDGDEAVPFLQVTERYAEPDGPRMSRAEMLDFLLAQHGAVCQGCDWIAHDARHLELDHNTPRSDGGLNHITNRILLCGPCNRLKSNTYTLSGLRRQNRKLGYMAS